jgi:C-terminal processing protease CtpA/Prc
MNRTVNRSDKKRLLIALIVSLACLGVLQPVDAQTLSFQRDRSREILEIIKKDLQKNYYDPTFHGVNVESVFKEADELLKKAESHGQMYGIIARALLQLNDSHTFFIAPSRVARLDYGWTMQTIGDKCYIAAVQPGSDAARKGLRAGDLVLSINQMNPERTNLWMIQYLSFLRPQSTTQFVVQSPNEPPRELMVQAKVTEGQKNVDLTDYNEAMKLIIEDEKDSRLRRHRYVEVEDVLIWKMPAFDLKPEKVDDLIDKARKHRVLILDLRGNGGGLEDTLLRLIGNLFDHDIKVGDLSRRKEKKPLVAKTRGGDIFKGNVVVLVDSASGSSSELLARVIQVEKRGVVVGDRSAGAVMRARYYSKSIGVDTVIFYGVSITDADLIMTDGKSLENVGVIPDELLLPSQTDLQLNRDPALARAAELAGLKLDAKAAGALFPVEWRKR